MNSKVNSHPELASSIDFLSAWIESQMAYKGQPGISVGIVYDQELIWAKGFGVADLESKKQATSKTIYRIASITKLFTSTAILQLRDAGKLQLDDPVETHLPWFKVQNKHSYSPPVLIRHLITHTSGLPRESASPYWSTADFPTYEQVRELLPEQELTLPTETKWKYSNLAVSLAGEVVSAVSGMSYEEYVEQNILEPLGMENTFVRTIDPANPEFASGYGRRLPDNSRAIRPFGDCKGISPAANMATNVEDLAKFAMLQFRDKPAGGDQILSGFTLREMHSVHWLDPDWQFGWGWGFKVTRLKGKTFAGHGGSLMGYRTEFQLCPEDKIGVIVLTNSDDGEPGVYAEKVFEWVGPEILKALAPKPEKKAADPAWDRYLGKYRSPWGDMQIMVYQGELVAVAPAAPDPSIDITRLTPVADHTFRMKMKNGFGAHGELVVFELDEEGNVERVKMGQNYSYPVSDW
ncbi:MAG: serine hydrolase [Anaerolineaceae bacterium]|nr:serine hydrolase [Anaerolineaceae bacterium]